MVGAWSDNQPDYSWLQPYETKSVSQYWYPFRNIGGVKNANLEAAVNLEVEDGRVRVGFYATKARPSSRGVVMAGGREIWSKTADLDPARPLQAEFELPAGVKEKDLRAALDAGGRELIAYQPKDLPKLDMPKPVEPPEVPAKMKTAEQLTLAGQRLEQLHNPSLEPDPYYEEALKRDTGDSRANVALGILYIKRARYADAEQLLQRAADRVSFNYTRPKDCEPLYYLGLSQKLQEKYAQAEDSLQRAAWCAAWQAPSYFQLAELAMLRGKADESLALVERSLVTNQWNTRALALKAVLLQKSGRGAEAALVKKQLSQVDPLDPKGYADPLTFNAAIASFPQEGIETATNLIEAGLWNEAASLLEQMKNGGPMAAYFRGWIAGKQGQPEVAKTWFKKASSMPYTLVFPFRREAEPVLRAAMQADPSDPLPPYYLGLFLFDRQPEQAMAMWRKTVELNPKMATAWRNLAVGYGRSDEGTSQAIASLERAIAANPEDASYLFELDKQYEWAQVAPEKRLALFQDRMAVTEKRDDAMARYVSALVLAGENDKAIGIMKKRHFHLWEGGVRFGVSDAWTDAHILRGQKELAAKQNEAALKDFLIAIDYPANLEATRAYRGSRAPEVFYWAGRAYEAMGEPEKAKQAWKDSAAELVGSEDNPEPTVNSGASLLYYRALSLEKLGEKAHAKSVFESLVKAGRDALKPAQGADFFAKFGERQSKQMSDSMAHYVTGLGYLGLGQGAKARAELEESVRLNKYLVGARATLASMRP
jgi:tetratricopeptide (TPR) repeat protein